MFQLHWLLVWRCHHISCRSFNFSFFVQTVSVSKSSGLILSYKLDWSRTENWLPHSLEKLWWPKRNYCLDTCMYSPNLYLCVATIKESLHVNKLTVSKWWFDYSARVSGTFVFFSPSPCNSKISCFLDGRLTSVNFRLIKGRFAIFHFNLLKTERQSWSKSEQKFQSLPPKSHHSLGHFFSNSLNALLMTRSNRFAW